ncbi:MAG: wax ester/triacylglycerol synthase family O-acyltransferase [Saprospiraceae bacterium]
MSQSKDRIEPISGMDAAFLYGETPSSPMHVGAVAVIEGSIAFDTFRAIIASRLHTTPRLRKRLMYVPLSIDYPYWVDDPYFDLDLHVHHIALPKPGGWNELRKVASQLFSEPMDLNRPLWSFTFVEGLDDIPQVPKGSVAIISKIHHVAIDGMSGAGLLSLIFDFTPEVLPIPEPKPWRPKPLPNEVELMWRSTMSFAKDPLKVPRLLGETVSATLKSGFLSRAQKTAPPTAPFSAPSTPFNGIISARRKWSTFMIDLERVKAIKNAMNTTLNDVVLAICAGGLRLYLQEKGQLPVKPLVAMVPISTRTEGEEAHGSNQISSMLVQLATNIADPIQRLEVIQENTIRGKTYNGAIGAKTLSKMAEAVPFGVANQAAKIYSRFHLAEFHNPVFNVTISNVPGPQFPLYINGHKLISISGTAPLFDGLGLIISVFSYNGLLTISPTADTNSMPDIEVFGRFMREATAELEKAIQEKGTRKKKTQANKAPKEHLASEPFFKELRQFLKDFPEAAEKTGRGIFLFEVTGASQPAYWKIDLNHTPGKISKTKAGGADVTFSVADEHLVKIATGQSDVQMAFIQGRLKVDGDFDRAMKMGGMLGKFMKEQRKKAKA